MQETGFLSTELSALACVHKCFYSTNFSQVWLHVRQKSRKFEEFCYILWQLAETQYRNTAILLKNSLEI
jgi:hypothetical protein